MSVAGMRGGDSPAPAEEEFRDALVSHLPRLRRFCLAIAGGQGGDDLCQATVLRALSRSELFAPGTRLDSWLFRIARNQHIDNQRRLRTRGTEQELESAYALAGEDGVRASEERSDLQRVTAAFSALPEEQRMVMSLVVVEGRSYKEAAEALEIPIGTVMSRLARARRALDAQLHDGGRS